MKILLVGNMGYVGPVLAQHLRQTYPDAVLIGFDAGLFAHCLLGAMALPEIVLDRQIFGDVRNLDKAVLEEIDVVVNLAAISNDPIGNRFEDATLAINYKAAVELSAKAKFAGARSYVFASSCSVYGCAEEGAKTESSSLDPLTAYARSKVMAEKELMPMNNSRSHVSGLRRPVE